MKRTVSLGYKKTSPDKKQKSTLLLVINLFVPQRLQYSIQQGIKYVIGYLSLHRREDRGAKGAEASAENARTEAPKAPRGVGCGEDTPSPLGVESGEGAVPPPYKFFLDF